MKIVVLDIETSGGQYNCPVQVAYFVYPHVKAFVNGAPLRTMFYVFPDDTIMPSCLAVHGMSAEALKDRSAVEVSQTAPLWTKMWDEVDGSLVIGYGVKGFDLPVLGAVSKRVGVTPSSGFAVLDVLELARRHIPASVSGDHKFDSVYAYLFPDQLETLFDFRCPHAASSDCELTRQMLVEMLRRWGVTVQQAWVAAESPLLVETFPFGKYKGKPISEVIADSGYCRWLGEQDFFVRDFPDACYSLCMYGKDPSLSPTVIAQIKQLRSGRAPLVPGLTAPEVEHGG